MSATQQTTPVLNGNKFVKIPHVFIQGTGCFFETQVIAVKEGKSPGGVGLWSESIEFEGKTWFRAGNLNSWD